jgi:hypothetical protein
VGYRFVTGKKLAKVWGTFPFCSPEFCTSWLQTPSY